MNNHIEQQNVRSTVDLPLLALRGIVVLPGMNIHFDVGRKKSMAALDEAMKSSQEILLFAQRDLRVADPSAADLYEFGTVARIKQLLKLPGDNVRVMVEGVGRARLNGFITQRQFILASADLLDEPETDGESAFAQALIRELRMAFDDYIAVAPKMSGEVIMNIMTLEDVGTLADYVASNILLNLEDRQAILSEIDPCRRLEQMVKLLRSEIEILSLELDIRSQVKEQIDKNQRDYYLREQMKIIQQELGEGENIQSEVEEYQASIAKLELTGETREALLKEVGRLSKMVPGSAEATVIRTYLDACLALPWNTETRDKLDLQRVKNRLDRDHYGLEKVKERIVEYLAVKKLTPQHKGQILCFVGPPGVGKTSIAISIARALGRKFARLSLGGIRDEAEIRGHRKTYIGAMPGRIMNAMKQAQSKNPVILLDEIDKMCSDFRGDPAAAMLEVLDSEQNYAFRDHFIEVPFDLSNVMFITTANVTDTIPQPLLDRMEVIELGSYNEEEKLQIAKRHLVPKQIREHGLSGRSLRFDEDALREIISGYTREAGVRNLERKIALCCRKAAAARVMGKQGITRITVGQLESYLGPAKYKFDHASKVDEIGIVTGLAWTSVGGDTLKIEVNAMEGTGKIELTGNLGDVMKESAHAAISYIRSRADYLGVDHDFYKNRDLHIHVPEGAIPKDGPSAGITMATALISELTQRPVRHDVAMTGEITIRGRVLEIGGLREKSMAAYRAGIKTIIIPDGNRSDLTEVDPTVRKNVSFVPVTSMEQVLKTALVPMKKASAQSSGEREKTLEATLLEQPDGKRRSAAIRQ
ncbi:endopeptidase La [Feifania hominis]|uniref:Lon protease n=1 Tax=Feifania hominis TaxID=2763660 RepID=A0A926DD06_9FIRM|nr:endopeptidase La [Feifania hominis]MBC8535597.1 endopeptidase La [Feifania hominis]